MTKSMTGYSRATSKEIGGIRWIVEIHSVNRKHLDIHMHLARELLFLDIELRKWVAQVLQRGNITVKISYAKDTHTQATVTLLKKLKGEWESIAESLSYKKPDITLPFLLEQLKDVSIEEFGSGIQDVLKSTLNEALVGLVKMQKTEGKALREEVLHSLKKCEENLAQIEQLSQKAPAVYRDKLQMRLEQLMEESLSDERLLKEVALFAEKVDVTEEIVRLKSHISQVRKHFQSDKSIGRALDFLMQEMMRETNTIGAKTQELEVTQLVLECKQELEKIREQVQNIE